MKISKNIKEINPKLTRSTAEQKLGFLKHNPRSYSQTPKLTKKLSKIPYRKSWKLMTRAKSLKTFKKRKLERLALMDESGQLIFEDRSKELEEINCLDHEERKKILLTRSSVGKILKPYYKNTWDHMADISRKQIRIKYPEILLHRQEKEIKRLINSHMSNSNYHGQKNTNSPYSTRRLNMTHSPTTPNINYLTDGSIPPNFDSKTNSPDNTLGKDYLSPKFVNSEVFEKTSQFSKKVIKFLFKIDQIVLGRDMKDFFLPKVDGPLIYIDNSYLNDMKERSEWLKTRISNQKAEK